MTDVTQEPVPEAVATPAVQVQVHAEIIMDDAEVLVAHAKMAASSLLGTARKHSEEDGGADGEPTGKKRR